MIEHMIKPNHGVWYPRFSRDHRGKFRSWGLYFSEKHCDRYFTQKDLFDAVREKYPEVKYDTLFRHLKDLVERGWILGHYKKIKLMVGNNNEPKNHNENVRLYSLRKRGLKNRDNRNSLTSHNLILTRLRQP